MSINLNPQITLSPSSVSSSGQTVTATVSVFNRPSYTGHPAINGLTTITPKIVCSRVPTGTAPFLIQVSSWGTVCNSGDAYSDLDYRWNFGDSNGAETFVDQWNGKTVNANTDQIGPEAAYLYRDAGNYTITLTATGKDENGNIVTASTTSMVTVSQYYIFVAGATSGTFTLTFDGQTTSAISYAASNDVIEAALHALSNLDSTNCRVTYRGCVELIGELAGTTNLLTADFSLISGAVGTPQLRLEMSSDTYASVSVSSVNSFSVRYFDSNYDNSNGSPDGTILRPYTTIASLQSWCLGASRTAYIKDDSVFTMTSSWTWTGGMIGVRLLRYGSGAKPIINTASYRFNIELSWGSASFPTGRMIGDIFFSDVVINHQASQAGVFNVSISDNDNEAYPYARLDDFVLSNIDYNSLVVAGARGGLLTAGKVDPPRGRATSKFAVWNCNLDMNVSEKQGLFVIADQWFCMVGGSIYGGSGNIVLDHHIYNSKIEQHQLYRWINFGTAVSKNYVLNMNAENNGRAHQCVLIDGCNITGTQNGIDFSNSQNSYAGYTGYFDDCIVQFNRIHSGQITSQQHGILCYNLAKITVRDNLWWDNEQWHFAFNDVTKPTTPKIYRNIFNDGRCRVLSGQIPYMRHNVMSTNTSGRSCIYLANDTVAATDLPQWDCDNNIYYAESSYPFSQNATEITSATWQGYGLDTNGTFDVDPNFPSGDVGVFHNSPTLSIVWPTNFTSLEYSLDDGDTWSAYTNGSDQSIGSSLTGWQEVLFRAATDDGSSETITVESNTNNSWISAEQFSAILASDLGILYYSIAFGGMSLILKVGN